MPWKFRQIVMGGGGTALHLKSICIPIPFVMPDHYCFVWILVFLCTGPLVVSWLFREFLNRYMKDLIKENSKLLQDILNLVFMFNILYVLCCKEAVHTDYYDKCMEKTLNCQCPFTYVHLRDPFLLSTQRIFLFLSSCSVDHCHHFNKQSRRPKEAKYKPWLLLENFIKRNQLFWIWIHVLIVYLVSSNAVTLT